jgi:hypothetical protein
MIFFFKSNGKKSLPFDLKIKFVGLLAPHPRKLLKKFEQNFTLNRANARFMKGQGDLSPC